MKDLLKERLVFRTMTEQDLSEVMSIESGASSYGWRQHNFQSSLQAGHLCVVAELNNTLIGHSVATIVSDEASLLIITIASPYQRSGYGAQLLQHIIHEISSRANTFFLEVRASNQAAIELYQNEGFNEIGHRKDYYPATGNIPSEDAVLMAMDLHQL